MKLMISRFTAVLLLVIPGLLATYGFLEIKNAIYDYIVSVGNTEIENHIDWLRLLIGVLCFSLGVGFIGGWIFFRDQKRNYVAPRFKQKQD
ncbi:DUF2627 domain-containing protein [Chengkuizengella axinellae]|uniref:DUF2627 domain-containing protein n=1 Tax=Chengkuizengella axinellae TaxID=3064388 RepID=A0ABT9IWA4_9BACL|nr:DUF2627 domain-containing protein [Chengkuizengella sp. 2205SS18-9]MDP5273622.1 DUF2627 domain-containing protein [Chengkuizengella sp. 2205SS18-9]